MNQSDLNRAVAHATGETVSTIKRLGFVLADFDDRAEADDSDELGPHVLDWDEIEINRRSNSQEILHYEPACC